MRTILITGGAGFIGSCLVRNVIGKGVYRVVTLDKLTYAGSLESLFAVRDHPHHEFVQGDIADASLIATLLKRTRPQAVFNLAAETHVDRSIDGPSPFVQTNVMGTVCLLEAVHDYWKSLMLDERRSFRLVHVSTDEVYGSLGATGSFSETSPAMPNSPYAASKAAADGFVRAYHQTYGLPTIITHCSNNYGPYQFPEKLIPLITLAAIAGKPLPIYGDGGQVRDWLHVEDHCEGLLAALQKGHPGATYNFGGDAQRTNLQVVKSICRLIDELQPELAPTAARIVHVADRPGHDRRYALDASKSRQELTWRPRHDFQSGLRETVSWYLANTLWAESVSSGGYRGERLGLERRNSCEPHGEPSEE